MSQSSSVISKSVVICGRCGAKSTESCVTSGGRVIKKKHGIRRRRANGTFNVNSLVSYIQKHINNGKG